jgi:hypothetical protein
VASHQAATDFLDDEIFGLKERLKILSPLGGRAGELDKPMEKQKRRLFCHLCEVFDKHDTDGCPLASTGSKPTAASRFKKASHTLPCTSVCLCFACI